MVAYVRILIVGFLLLLCACAGRYEGEAAGAVPIEHSWSGPPNIVVILADDLGYGDLGCYGSHQARTPHLDRLAAGGLKFTSFYAFPSCSPSRAALLTGCYPQMVGIPDVVGPPGLPWTADKQHGLHPDEVTLADMLKANGYATGMVGKWHLGHFAETMPTRQGFDYFFGLPYSNDMLPEKGYPDLPLLRGTDTVELNPDQHFLTRRYTEEAVDFIGRHRDTSFFLYLAHSMPHTPIYASPEFEGRSGRGTYADVIEELDHSVGQIAAKLAELGLSERTLILFTSDNGPWLAFGNHAGSAGPFREGKGTTWEGGMRVPTIASWPGTIEAGRVTHAPASVMDVLPTVSALTGSPLPDVSLSGADRSGLLLGKADDPAPFLYYKSGHLDAIRVGDWKLHLPHRYRYVDRVGNDGVRGKYAYRETGEELYNLADDPAERYDVAAAHPDRVAELRTLAEKTGAEVLAAERPAYRPGE